MNALGLHVDPSIAFALTTADQAKVDEGVEAIRDLLSKDTGSNGNRDDIMALMETLEGLSPAELDAVVDELSDDELSELGDMVNDTDDSGWKWWDHNGLERWERLDFYGIFLSQVSPSRLDRIAEAFPGVNPSFTSTDTYLDGENSQTGEGTSDIDWGVPPGQVFQIGPDGKPLVDASQMNQGSFGDCWFIASVTAAQQQHPDFIPTHMRQNANGTVSVKMYDDDGNEHWVTVTPELPVDENGQPVGAHGTDGELWPAYYEKAFALAYQGDEGGAPDGKEGDDAYDQAEEGTYGAIEWDYNEQAPPYVTGDDGDGIDCDVESISEAVDEGRPVIVSTPSEVDHEPKGDESSYSTRHVYYVKDVSEDSITLGNPWGSDYPDITMSPEEFEEYFEGAHALDMPE